MIRAVVVAAGLTFGIAAGAAASCAADRVTVRGDWGQATFTVRVADDNASRSQGLMHVESMGRLEGMLFVYDAPQRATFWMRNTLIPLDMIFADAQGVVTRVHENAIPLDETSIDGGDGVQFVLEINGDMSRRLGIGEGDVMRHPAIGPEAALPCPAG